MIPCVLSKLGWHYEFPCARRLPGEFKRHCWYSDLRRPFMYDQLTFSDGGQGAKRTETRRYLFLIEIGKVFPRLGLETVMEPSYPRVSNRAQPYPLRRTLRVHDTVAP